MTKLALLPGARMSVEFTLGRAHELVDADGYTEICILFGKDDDTQAIWSNMELQSLTYLHRYLGILIDGIIQDAIREGEE